MKRSGPAKQSRVLKVENNEGVITLPTPEQGDQQIVLSLTTKVKKRQFRRDFPITIRAENAVNDAA